MIDSVLEIPAEHLVFGIGCRIGPDRPQPSHQSGNPVGRLNCLIAVAFQMNGGSMRCRRGAVFPYMLRAAVVIR